MKTPPTTTTATAMPMTRRFIRRSSRARPTAAERLTVRGARAVRPPLHDECLSLDRHEPARVGDLQDERPPRDTPRDAGDRAVGEEPEAPRQRPCDRAPAVGRRPGVRGEVRNV